jgi:hypothetical protein
MPTKKSRAEYMRMRRQKQKELAEKQASTEVVIVEKKSVLPIDKEWGKTQDKAPVYHLHRGRVYPGATHELLKTKIIEEDTEEEDDYYEEEEEIVSPPVHNFVNATPPPPQKLIAPPPTYRVGQFFNCKQCGYWQAATLNAQCVQCRARYIFDADRSHALSEWLDPSLGELINCSYCGKTHQIEKMCIAKKRAMKNTHR